MTIQSAVTDSLETLGHCQEFPVTTKLARKVLDLEWTTQTTDELGLGLHIFTLGWTPPALTEQLKQLNTVVDSMSGGESAPSVADATATLDADDDVHVPRSFAQLRYGIERMYAFHEVLLGPRHTFNLRL